MAAKTQLLRNIQHSVNTKCAATCVFPMSGTHETLEKLLQIGPTDPDGGDMDPPNPISFVFLVQWPTTLLKNVWPNFAPIKSYK